MIFLQKFLNILIYLSLLGSPASTVDQVRQRSLWGKVVDFGYKCNHLTLKPHVSIPALQEFTICLHLKFKVQAISPWTAFIYHHPDVKYSNLVLGGKRGHFVVRLFGTEWTTRKIKLRLSQWHSVCLTWSHMKDRPALYVDGELVGMTAAQTVDAGPPLSSWYRKLAPNGTLTLGVADIEHDRNIHIIPFTGLFGKLSLFRLWARERSQQEVTSLYCTEGDLVKWDMDNWDTQACTLLPDASLQCKWSFYEVRLKFAIIRYDGNNTESHTARAIARQWIREVLPRNMFLNRVSVFEVARSSTEGSLVKASDEDGLARWASPNINRFECLVHVSVIPGCDVADVQNEIYVDLRVPYYDPSRLLQLLSDETSIHTTPIESFSTSTTSPPDVATKPSPVTTTVSPSTSSATTTLRTSHTSTVSAITTNTSTAAASTTITSTSTGAASTITSISTGAAASTVSSTSTGAATITSSTATGAAASTTTDAASTITSISTGAAATTTTTTTSTSTDAASTITSTSTGEADSTTITSISTGAAATTTTTTTSTSTDAASTITSTSTGTAIITSSTATGGAASTTTSPTNISELYFEVKVNVSITRHPNPEQILSTWLSSCLPDDIMMVLDLQLLPKVQSYQPNLQSNLTAPDEIFAFSVSSESCVFQVQVTTSLSDTQETEEQIRDLLLIPFNNGSITIVTEDVKISRILILECNAETHQTRKGLFEWPTTSGGKNATQPCPKNPHRYAIRQCKLCLRTHWMAPDLEDCLLVVETILDLGHVEVTADNALDVVEMIEALLSNDPTLNYQEMVTVINKLEDIVNLSVITPNLGQALINIISDILESESNLLPFTNTILNITEAVGDRMVGYEGTATLVASAVAISVVDIVPGQFSSLTFGVSSDRTGTKPEIFINRYPLNSTVAFISLPSTLQHSFPQTSLNQSPPRVQFQFYGIPVLFESSKKGPTLNTFVVSASVTNASSPIKDLDENIRVTLRHLEPNILHKDVQCVYWNFNKNNERGGWDDYGCRMFKSRSDYTTCLCDHLTHFGVLLDVSRTQVDPANEQILTIVTYIGCGVSSVFLGVTVLTYTFFEKLRRDYPSQILINLSLALLGLNLTFLVNSWLSSWGVYAICIAAASTLHYFLLASFTWMGLEAVNMYFALVKVFNVYVPSYILKFCALGWGLPLMVCILVLIVNREAYGSDLYTDGQPSFQSLDNSNNFCWLQDNVTFYMSVVGYAVLIFLFNTGIFVVVLIQIRHMRVNSPAGTHSGLMHDLKGVASLTLLLGLTWTVGFFTFGPARVVLLYLFSGLNSLQGLFIFLFHCLMKANVRKQWRIHLCLGRFRLEEYSEWSNSASAGVVAKPRSNPTRASVPSVHSVKSSSTESTSASSDSSQRGSSCKRPNLGLFVTYLTLPRAQRSPSEAGALLSQRGLNQAPGRRTHFPDQQAQR